MKRQRNANAKSSGNRQSLAVLLWDFITWTTSSACCKSGKARKQSARVAQHNGLCKPKVGPAFSNSCPRIASKPPTLNPVLSSGGAE